MIFDGEHFPGHVQTRLAGAVVGRVRQGAISQPGGDVHDAQARTLGPGAHDHVHERQGRRQVEGDVAKGDAAVLLAVAALLAR